MKKLLKLSVVITFSFLGCSRQPQPSESAAVRAHLQTLVSRLESGSVTRIEVSYIPPRIETPVALSPTDLDRTFDYRLTLQSSASPHSTQTLATVLRESKVYESNNQADIRIGLAFYSSENTRIGAIYLSGDCGRGQVDGISVAYVGDACSWTKHALSGVL
jgi:hypothetical protein